MRLNVVEGWRRVERSDRIVGRVAEPFPAIGRLSGWEKWAGGVRRSKTWNVKNPQRHNTHNMGDVEERLKLDTFNEKFCSCKKPFSASFYFRLFVTIDGKKNCQISHLWCQKRLLYQLHHNHCATIEYHQCSLVPISKIHFLVV